MEGSSKNSINDWRKTYPLRKRVSEADALKSIQQWLESNEDVSIESEWETSSEEDQAEDESNEGEVNFPPPPPLQFQPDIAAGIVKVLGEESSTSGAPVQ